MTLTATTLARCTRATVSAAAPYVDPLNRGMARFAIDQNHMRIAGLLATAAIETQYLTAVEENLNYSTPARLRLIFPSLFVPARGGRYVAEEYVRNKGGLSKIKYAGYHGRGLAHLTWKDAYKAAGDALGFDYVGQPQIVMEPEHAALTACWFWAEYKHLNPVADRGDLNEIRRRVNGEAMLQLAEFKAQWATAMTELAKAAP